MSARKQALIDAIQALKVEDLKSLDVQNVENLLEVLHALKEEQKRAVFELTPEEIVSAMRQEERALLEQKDLFFELTAEELVCYNQGNRASVARSLSRRLGVSLSEALDLIERHTNGELVL